MTVHEQYKEVSRTITPNMIIQGYKEGGSFSRRLEELDPSDKYPQGSVERNMTAFERQLMAHGIFTRSDPDGGFAADKFEKFNKNDATRALGMEWMKHQFRKVKQYSPMQKRALLSGNMLNSDAYTPGSLMRPVAEAASELIETLTPQIPLTELVAVTTGIDSDTYKALYIDWGTDSDYHMRRVEEGTDLPSVTITSGERDIKLHKYGIKIDATYEALRRSPIDQVALLLQRIAVEAEVDKASKVLDVIVNGDGNANTSAEVFDLSVIDDDATAGTLTLRGWLAYKLKVRNPYVLTTILGREDTILDLLMLPVVDTNGGLPLVAIGTENVFGGLTPMSDEMARGIRYAIVDDAPADQLVGFDRRLAIERVYEIGGDISEMGRWIHNQTESLTMSEYEGYRVFDNRAAWILDVAS